MLSCVNGITNCGGANIPTEPVISAGMTIIPTGFCSADNCPPGVSMCSAVGYCTTIADLSFPDATSMVDSSLCSGSGCDALTSLEIPLITTIPDYFFASIASPHLL